MNAVHVVAGVTSKIFKTFAGLTGLIAGYYYVLCFIGRGGPFELYAAFLWTFLALVFATVYLFSSHFAGGE